MASVTLRFCSVLACAFITSSAPPHQHSQYRAERRNTNGLARDTHEINVEDHVITTPPPDSSTSQYGVHRIDRTILFPQNTVWCVARPIKQIVDHPGCSPRTIENKMCTGQCYSYAVPKLYPEPDEAEFHSCDCCMPSRSNWAMIPLSCNDAEEHTVLRKFVEIVEECECTLCSLRDSTDNSSLASLLANNVTESSYDHSSYVESSSNA